MGDRVDTIRWRVEGTREVTSKIDEMTRAAARQQKELANSLKIATQQQAGGLNPGEAIRRATQDAARLSNIRSMQVKEQANLEQRELANSRKHLANVAGMREANHRKQQAAFSDLATARISADEKADRTILIRRQKRNDAEFEIGAKARKREQTARLADLGSMLSRETAKARDYEVMARRGRSGGAMAGALSGFGGKMVMGMAAGELASDIFGLDVGAIGSIASGFMFGGPVVGGAVAGAQVLGTSIKAVREDLAKVRDLHAQWNAELRTSVSQWEKISQSVGPQSNLISALGGQSSALREKMFKSQEELRGMWADASSPFSTVPAQTGLELYWSAVKHPFTRTSTALADWPNRTSFGQQIQERTRDAARNSAQLEMIHRAARADLDARAKEQQEDRSFAVQQARTNATYYGETAKRMQFDQKVANERRKLVEENDRDRKLEIAANTVKAVDAQERAMKAQRYLDFTNRIGSAADREMARAEVEQAVAEKKRIEAETKVDIVRNEAARAASVAAFDEQSKLDRRARSLDFIMGENERLSPIYQLNEYRIKLKEAVDQNVETMDGARMKLQRKTMELYGSVLHPGDFRAVDSRARINIAAMNPMMAMMQSGLRKIPAYASGTNDTPGGIIKVGEAGAEHIIVPQHSKVIPHGGLINGMPADYWLGGLPILKRGRIYQHGSGLEAYAHSRQYAGTVGTREIGSSAAFQEWAATHPLHKIRHGEPPVSHTVQKQSARHFAEAMADHAVKSSSGTGGYHHTAGYYQSHSMLARVRAAHRRASGGLIDPLTGRALDTGSFSSMDSRGGGPGGSMAQSGELTQMVRQILGILQTHGVN